MDEITISDLQGITDLWSDRGEVTCRLATESMGELDTVVREMNGSRTLTVNEVLNVHSHVKYMLLAFPRPLLRVSQLTS
jgi:hypothetical protein